MNRVTAEINLRSERMLTAIEWFLTDYSKDQSSSAMEGTLASGGEIWLRDFGTMKSGLVSERWWVDHRLRTVVMDGDGHEHTRKGSGKGKARREVSSSLKKIVSFFCSLTPLLYDVVIAGRVAEMEGGDKVGEVILCRPRTEMRA
jgi:hypothetical protein